MADNKTTRILERVYRSDLPDTDDLIYLLSLEDKTQVAKLFDFADSVREHYHGNHLVLRGIIEFSNYCKNTCRYCGLNCNNKKLTRYQMTDNEIFTAADMIVDSGIKTIVLQSGEFSELDSDWFADIIKKLKMKHDIAVTLSVGECSRTDYEKFKSAGADRYLLKIETTDIQLYNSLHPDMSFENRIRCIKDLGELGYQTGSGNLIGLPGQTVESVAEDIQFFKKTNLDMVSTGPFIPNENTPLALTKPADIEFALKALATARIVTKNAHIPANTAYASLKDSDSRPRALKAGANVIMPNFTPPQYRGFYEIYPDKRCLKEPYENWLAQVKRITENLNWSIDYSRADTLKKENNGKITPVLLN